MTDKEKREIINNLNLIADRVETDWKSLTITQVEGLKGDIEALWEHVCRRVKR